MWWHRGSGDHGPSGVIFKGCQKNKLILQLICESYNFYQRQKLWGSGARVPTRLDTVGKSSIVSVDLDQFSGKIS